MRVGRPRWTSLSTCSTACWTWDARTTSASPEHVGAGVSAAAPLIPAPRCLGRETIVPTRRLPGMSIWREELFSLLHRNAQRSAAYFCVPARQVVEIGVEIEI